MDVVVRPDRTYALVVGIEKYELGALSDLDGPANDAWQFTNWLLRMNVPDENIFLFLSSPEQNKTLNSSVALSIKEASRENIRHTIEILPKLEGDLLWFFWAGHGVVTLEDRNRLYYADAIASDKKNLDVPSLLWFLKSNDVKSFPRQIFIFDTCASYLPDGRWDLPDDTFAPSRNVAPVMSHEQFVLFAGRPGEAAMNSAERRAGYLSEVVMRELIQETGHQWPPDMGSVTAKVKNEFKRRRKNDLSGQTPRIFWYRTWEDDLIHYPFEQLKLHGTTERTALHNQDEDPVTSLVSALKACRYMRIHNSRQIIIDRLRPEIRDTIMYEPDTQLHITNVVTTCLNYEGGMDSLIHILGSYEKRSKQMKGVEALWNAIRSTIDADT